MGYSLISPGPSLEPGWCIMKPDQCRRLHQCVLKHNATAACLKSPIHNKYDVNVSFFSPLGLVPFPLLSLKEGPPDVVELFKASAEAYDKDDLLKDQHEIGFHLCELLPQYALKSR